jgi:hypothetical protein
MTEASSITAESWLEQWATDWRKSESDEHAKGFEVTVWFDGNTCPSRTGLYQRMFVDGVSTHYWDGKLWLCRNRNGDYATPHWRQQFDYPLWRGLTSDIASLRRITQHVSNERRKNDDFLKLVIKWRGKKLRPGITQEQFEAAMKIGFDAAWEAATDGAKNPEQRCDPRGLAGNSVNLQQAAENGTGVTTKTNCYTQRKSNAGS